MAEKIDSDVTGLHYAKEVSLKVLPETPIWKELEPNSYSDFGGDVKTVARNPIHGSRQRKKGTVVGLEAEGGFTTDLTQNNTTDLFQGFFFADMREKPTTAPINGTAIALTSVTSPANEICATAGMNIFKAKHLVLVSGSSVAANNGLTKVNTAVAAKITVSKNMVAEAAPSANMKVEAVGFEFAAGDLTLSVVNGNVMLASAAIDLTTLGLTVGEWIFVGGDDTTTKYATNDPGYGRIKSIAAGAIVLDDVTFTPTADVGAGKTIRVFFGNVIRNEKDPSLIKRTSYQFERQLGDDADGVQSEYIIGAIPNELKLNTPLEDKMTVELSFAAMDNEYRTGDDGIKAGTRIAAKGEDAFNTSSDIYRIKLNIVDPTTASPSSLFGFVSECSLNIKNNVSGNKALGVLGAFEATTGDFEVSGSVNAYFSTVGAVQAVKDNSDVALNIICAQHNAGFVLDAPLISLGGGRISVEKDKPITLPIEHNATECPAGYTLLSTWFPYLPTAAMP